MGRSDRADGDMARLLALLDEACEAVEGYRPRDLARHGRAADHADPASLLDQCLALCAERDAHAGEPVRTVHHMACTGGTLIAKCLAAMPNVQLLSEVDPLSPFEFTGDPKFAPTDLIRLLRQSTRGTDDRLVLDVFRAALSVILADCSRHGLRLVLRDHAHSHYCLGDRVPQRPGLRTIVASVAPVLAVVTVRHPVDSYLSLRHLGWAMYSPPGIDEYCRRYMAFLDDHADLPLFRYEEFVAAPDAVMRLLCQSLDVPFRAGFQDLIGAFSLTGDSGRKGEIIQHRPRRTVPDAIAGEIQASTQLATLLQRLGYDD